MMSEDGLSTLAVPIHIAQDHIPKLLIYNKLCFIVITITSLERTITKYFTLVVHKTN